MQWQKFENVMVASASRFATCAGASAAVRGRAAAVALTAARTVSGRREQPLSGIGQCASGRCHCAIGRHEV